MTEPASDSPAETAPPTHPDPRQGRPSKAVGCAALGALAILGVFLVWRAGSAILDKLDAAPSTEATPVHVEVTALEPEPFDFTVGVSGALEPLHSVDVFPKLGGRVVRMNVGLGDAVHAGDPLATVESPEYALMVQKAEQGVAIATEAAKVADDSLARLVQVREKLGEGALSEQDFETAQVQVQGARTQAQVAKLDRSLARQMVHNATMTAPVDGTVSKVNARLGGMVGKEFPSFHIADTSQLVLRCQVGDLDLPRVEPGQPVVLSSDALPGTTLEGTVTAVSSSLDSWTHRAPIEITVENPQGAVPGNLFVRGRIIVQRDAHTLVVPIEAVQTTAQGTTVQLARDGRVHTTPVTVRGQHQGRIALGGLKAGDLVILPGAAHLAEGEKIVTTEQVNATVGGD